jgi:hypothetical protein
MIFLSKIQDNIVEKQDFQFFAGQQLLGFVLVLISNWFLQLVCLLLLKYLSESLPCKLNILIAIGFTMDKSEEILLATPDIEF